MRLFLHYQLWHLICFFRPENSTMRIHIHLLTLFLMLTSAGCAVSSEVVSTSSKIADSTVHYFTNGKVSVIRTPWIDGKRETKFFNLKSELTYTIEEVRLSYQVSADLKFYENGGVETVHVFTNPGASRYSFNSTILFSTVNEPQWKIDKKTPAESIADANGDKYFWHKKEKRWVKQEIISCAPVPVKEE